MNSKLGAAVKNLADVCAKKTGPHKKLVAIRKLVPNATGNVNLTTFGDPSNPETFTLVVKMQHNTLYEFKMFSKKRTLIPTELVPTTLLKQLREYSPHWFFNHIPK